MRETCSCHRCITSRRRPLSGGSAHQQARGGRRLRGPLRRLLLVVRLAGRMGGSRYLRLPGQTPRLQRQRRAQSMRGLEVQQPHFVERPACVPASEQPANRSPLLLMKPLPVRVGQERRMQTPRRAGTADLSGSYLLSPVIYATAGGGDPLALAVSRQVAMDGARCRRHHTSAWTGRRAGLRVIERTL